MKLYKITIVFCCLIITFALIVGCSGNNEDDAGDGDDTKVSEAYDATDILNHYANNVIYAIYSDLDTEAGVLLDAVKALQEDTSQSNLKAAQEAWVAARIPWEKSEAFLFGPVDTQGLDPALDSWPVDRVNLQAVLDGDDELTTDYVTNELEDTQKGFHTIEYLLFREGDKRQASDITDRELEYLLASTMNLKDSTAQLANAWAPNGENFVNTIVSAGEGNSVYRSQSSALQEMIDGMITIADEVANGKISDPYNQEDTTLVESQFSFNSIADFQDNIRGIQAVYTGNFNSDGPGLDDFVSSNDSTLDTRFKTEVQAAIDAIGAIPNPFRDAITHDRAAVQAAIDAVGTVHISLQQDILTLIGESKFK